MERDETVGQVNLRRWEVPDLTGVARAGLGAAGSLGSLSVPPSWAMAAPEMHIEPVSVSVPATDVDAAQEVTADSPPGRAFQQGLMAMVTRRGAMTHAADHNTGEKDDESNTEARCAEAGAQDDAAMDGCAGASATASTLTPFSPKFPLMG